MGKIDTQLPIYLPFYDNIERQVWRRGYSMQDDRCTVKRITNQYRLPPFQIRRPSIPAAWTADFSIGLYCPDDTLQQNILSIMNVNDADLKTYGQYDYFTYYGNIDLTQPMTCGTYYLRISDGTNVWWSELITVETFSTDSRLIVDLQDFNDFFNF